MKRFLIITQFIYLLCLVPWLIVWGLSFMGFDAGISVFNVALVVGIGLYPVAVIVCSVTAWLVHKRRKRTAVIVNSIPLLWVIGLGVPLMYINFIG